MITILGTTAFLNGILKLRLEVFNTFLLSRVQLEEVVQRISNFDTTNIKRSPFEWDQKPVTSWSITKNWRFGKIASYGNIPVIFGRLQGLDPQQYIIIFFLASFVFSTLYTPNKWFWRYFLLSLETFRVFVLILSKHHASNKKYIYF